LHGFNVIRSLTEVPGSGPTALGFFEDRARRGVRSDSSPHERQLFVDPDAPKPTPISLHVDFSSVPGCQLNPNGAAQLKRLQRERVLRYQAGTYHLH